MQDESRVSNRYGRGDVSPHDHVRDAWVDVNPHRSVFVDEDLIEEYPFRLAYLDEGIWDDESFRPVWSQPATSEAISFGGFRFD